MSIVRLESLKEVHQRHQSNYEQLHQELVQTVKELDEGEERAPMLARRFKDYQELRGYVSDLVECLDEKVGWYAVTFLFLWAPGFYIPRERRVSISHIDTMHILYKNWKSLCKTILVSRNNALKMLVFHHLEKLPWVSIFSVLIESKFSLPNKSNNTNYSEIYLLLSSKYWRKIAMILEGWLSFPILDQYWWSFWIPIFYPLTSKDIERSQRILF